MPSIPLHVRKATEPSPDNPLPRLLHTPSGLALLELQGTIHFPEPGTTEPSTSTQVGKLVFPLYDVTADPSDTKWMKRVYFYIGKNQRMAGECKKLPKPFALIRKKEPEDGGEDMEMGGVEEGAKEELEIVEIVRFKIVFSTRPEPVSEAAQED